MPLALIPRFLRAEVRLLRRRLRRWRQRAGALPRPRRLPGWLPNGLPGWPGGAAVPRLRTPCLRLAAASGIACALLTVALVALAAWRARLSAPAPTLLLLDRGGRFLGEIEEGASGGASGNTAGLGYWPVGSIPPRVTAATLALEDRHFARHPGVDALAVARAILQNLRARERISGASTLAMQVARLQHPGGRGYLRKLTEAMTAFFLTARYGREEVLRQYLRIVPYGGRVHGIAYAARSYFDKPMADLSWAEIAFLAALPQAPSRMNPYLPAGRFRAVRRGQHALTLLAARGLLSPAELELARRQLAAIRIPERERRPQAGLHALLRLQAQLASRRESTAPRHGPVVRTTLDLELQDELALLTSRALREWRSEGAGNTAVVVVDTATHEVLAWVGSAGYFDGADQGAIDYTRVRRPSGSTLKPFLYALALERGTIRPATILDDLHRGPGGIANADGTFFGPLLPRLALANSRNVPAANLLTSLGLEQGFGLMRELGLVDPAVPPRRYGLGLAVGGLPVRLEDLARAYLVLAGDGRLPALRWLRDEAPVPSAPRVFSEETVRQITLFLSDPEARLPTFPRMGATEYRFPVAVKTGTSTDYHDAWALAYSPRYLAGAWVGHPGFRPMHQLSGYLSAAAIVQRVLARLHRGQDDGLADLAFPAPRGFRPVRVCALSGARAGPACDQVFLEWFPPGEEPVDECPVHQRRAVDRRNGLLASAGTPAAMTEVRTFVDLPPRYAAWQEAAGLPRPPLEASPLFAGGEEGGGAHSGQVRQAGQPWHPGRLEPAAGARAAEGTGFRLRIVSPEHGAQLLRDPETPADQATVALSAVVNPPADQVLWIVDGRPFRLVAYPYTTRWPLAPGEHTFQVRLPLAPAASRVVHITVR